MSGHPRLCRLLQGLLQSHQCCEPRIRDLSAHELADPGVTDLGLCGYDAPLSTPCFKALANLGVKLFHCAIIAKLCA